MKKIISLFLVFAFIFIFAACGKNTKKSVIGKWYNVNNIYLEVLSDNTHLIGNALEPEEIYRSGEWKYLEKEKFFKFTDNEESSFLKIEIKSDKYGTYIEYGKYGKFYKGEYPRILIENDLELQEANESITCPKFVGQSYEEILDNKEYTKNFTFKYEWSPNGDYAYGVVFEQSEKPNEKLKKGAEVILYISMGKSNVKVPDVYGMTESAAVSLLKSAGFKVIIVEELNINVQNGMVVRTEPQRTTVVSEGETVNVYISSSKLK